MDFDSWNEVKKRISAEGMSRVTCAFPKKGEVWMCVLGKNIGFEQDGAGETFSRPVLVVKKFNNQMAWAVPLSTKQKNIDFYYNFTDCEGRDVSVILAQIRLLSTRRFKRKLYELEGHHRVEISKRLASYCL